MKIQYLSERLRHYTAWLCLLMQLFTITTPVVAAVATTPPQQPSSWVQDLLSRPARPYTLGPGETPAVLAERLGLTLVQLQTFNQLRTFSKPFAQLSTGDELDIPATDVKLSSQPSQSTPLDGQQKAADTQLAGQLTGLAGIAASDDAAAAAASAARSVVTGAANNAVEQWLGQYGTVQAQLSMNDDWRLEDSSIDWLVPFYETRDNLMFTQLGWRNKDDRNTVNLGLGMRWFTVDSMYGLNGFYDADLTGDNRRLGLGLEYWRDYMTMSANGYFRLTDWHQSMDFADYDERPANGWDVRLNGWLPSYPQLGGKLIYEKYYGDEVALFGNDQEQRQKDPRAVTAGINWTPFPLLTLGLDHRIGDDGMNDTNINLQLTWKPDESWDSQVSPSAVAGMRLLDGTRHNLVDRNNDIVLEYRKQVLIKATVSPSSVRGVPGSTHGVTVQVNSKYPLQSVSWDAASFLAAGGTLSQPDLYNAKLTLPPYQMPLAQTAGKVAAPSNFYVLTSTAVDNNGNRATPQEITVEVLPPNASLSGITLEDDGAVADGIDTNSVKAKVSDADGNPLSGQTVSFTATNGAVVGTVAPTDAAGETTVTLTSTTEGTSTVTAEINGSSQTVNVTFVAAGPNIDKSTLTAVPATIEADASEASVVTLALKDANSNAISGETVTFSSTLAGTVFGAVTDQGDGNYTASMTGTSTGTATITANLNGNAFAVNSAVVTLTPDSSNALIAAGDLDVLTTGAVASGTATNSVKVKVTDAGGNPLSGLPVRFTAPGAVLGTIAPTDAAGETTVTLTSTVAGTVPVTAEINGSSQSVNVDFVADSASAKMATMVATTTEALADGTDTTSVDATVTDKHGNKLSGYTVGFSTTNGATPGFSAPTDVNGKTSVNLTNTRVGPVTVIGTAGVSSMTAGVNFIADAGSAGIAEGNLVAQTTGAIADGTATNIVKAKVTDGNGVALEGQTVTFTASNGAVLGTAALTDAKGETTVTVTNITAGESVITAAINGDSDNSVPVAFVANTKTAQISDANMTAIDDNAQANGTMANVVQVKVTDANNNVLPAGQVVTFTSDNPDVTFGTVAPTDAAGITTASLTLLGVSANPTPVNVIATLSNGAATTKQMTFASNNNGGGIAGSALTVPVNNAEANGTATNTVKAKVTDTTGSPIGGVSVTFTVTGDAQLSSPTATTDANGDATVTLTSANPGVSSVMATFNGSKPKVDVTFVAGTIDPAQSSFEPTPAVISADNIEYSRFYINVKDTAGRPVTHLTAKSVTSTGTNGTGGWSNLINHKDGRYSWDFRSAVPTVVTVTAVTFNTGTVDLADVTVEAADTSHIPDGELKVVTDNSPANNLAKNRVAVKVVNKAGVPQSGKTVNFSADNGATIAATATTNSSGLASAFVTSGTEGASVITANVNGKNARTASMTFTADNNVSGIGELTPGTNGSPADGTTTNSVKAKVTNKDGNPVEGQTVTFTATNGAVLGTVTPTDANGETTVTLTSTKAGVSNVIAAINGSSRNIDMTFAADLSSAGVDTAEMMTSNAVANGTATNSVKAKVIDKNGNPVVGQTVAFSTIVTDATVGTAAPTDASGETTVTLTSTAAGVVPVEASFNGSAKSAEVSFVADRGTPVLKDDSVITVLDGAVANSSSTNSVKAIVVDKNGDAVPGQTVAFTVSPATAKLGTAAQTDANGETTVTVTSSADGAATVTASINGTTQTADVNFVVDNGEGKIGGLTVVTDSSPANGTATNSVKAKVTDANGAALADKTVTFTATNGAVLGTANPTDANGETTVTLTSTLMGDSMVTAEINGSSQTVGVKFIADPDTFVVSKIELTNSTPNLADGKDSTNWVNIYVSDANGNVSDNVGTLSITATNGAVVPAEVNPYRGVAMVFPTSTRAGVSTITASINGSSQSIDVTFVGDHKTAQIASGDLDVMTTDAPANGMATSSVKVKVTDANNNPVSGQTVSFSTTNGATPGTAAPTDANGETTVTLTSTTVGVATVIATINGNSQTVDVNFVADTSGTGGIAANGLVVGTNDSPADGTTTNSVKATVTDANGNPVSGQTVSFTVTNGATAGTAAPTDANGETTVTLTSTTVGVSTVTAEVNSSIQKVDVNFVAGAASTTTSTLTALPAIMADGKDASALTLTLKDAASNGVSGETVGFTVTGVTGTTVSAVKDNGDGTYTANLTGTEVGTAQVSATVAGSAFGVTAVPVTLVTPLPSSTQFRVNGHLFAADSGFPTTGFANAKFQIVMDGSAANNGNYTWSSSQPWVGVDASGNVAFTGTPTSATKTVIITAVPTGGGESLTWRFTVNKWFTGVYRDVYSQDTAITNTCPAYGGVPSVSELTNGGKNGGSASRQTGNLWSEWGMMSSYPGMKGGKHWSSEKTPGDNFKGYQVDLTSGTTNVHNSVGSGSYFPVACRQSL